MQAVRNHIPVARYDRSPPALVPDYLRSIPCSSNGRLKESSQRIIQARFDTYYEYAAEGLQALHPEHTSYVLKFLF